MSQTLLIVTGALDIGGTEHHLIQVLPCLPQTDWRVIVFTVSHKGVLAPKVEAAGIPVIEPPFSALIRRRLGRVGRRALLPFLSASNLLYVMLRHRPAIVHFFLPEAYLVGGVCAHVARCPVRVMSRRSLNVYQRGQHLAARVERWLHGHMRAILGNSRAVIDELRAEGVPDDRLGLIYNGIDVATYADACRVARATLDVADDALVLITVANLIAYKGHADLLAALAKISDTLPVGWRLLCVGRDDGYGAELSKRAASLGLRDHVRWFGERSDVPALLACADIGILCSHQEGFANSVLEGMAAGLPMVVTDVGGNREAVEDGVSGVVVPAHDPQALGTAIAALAQNPARRTAMGAAGRRRVAETFSLDACAQRYVRLYGALSAGSDDAVAAMIETDQ